MATQLVQYMDLRRTIDVNPPAYEYTDCSGGGADGAPSAAPPHVRDHRQEELETLKQQYAQSQHELITIQLEKRETEIDTPSEVARIFDLVDSEPSRQTSRQSSKQTLNAKKTNNPRRKKSNVPSTSISPSRSMQISVESRPSTKDTKASGKSVVNKPGGKGSKSPTRQSRTGSKAGATKSDDENDSDADDEVRRITGDGKEYAEVAIQDEGGDPNAAVVDDKIQTPNTRHSKRAKSTLDPVLESDYDNAFDLWDEESWSAIHGDQLPGKFAQYRRLGKHRIHELEEQLQLTEAKTKRKVMTLKAQFQEHKGKWEAERKILIEQVDQSLRLQTDAEKEADAAMTQLEDFITEQERLEQEEEVKRGEILQSSASLTPQDGLTPHQRSLGASPDATTPGQVLLTPESEQELQRLMQQTDDAKSARQGMSSTSTRASSEGSVLVGTLLDVTRPINEKQPSPDTPSTQAPTPAVVAAHPKSAEPTEESTIRIESTQHDVSEQVLNEVGLMITTGAGHVAVLKSPEEKEEKAEKETVESFDNTALGLLTAVESISFAVAGVDSAAVQEVSGSMEKAGTPTVTHPPSGQPLPGSAKSQIKSTMNLNLNPVILIMPGGQMTATDDGKPKSIQALIPGAEDMQGDSSNLEIEIIPQKEVEAVVEGMLSSHQQQVQVSPSVLEQSREASVVSGLHTGQGQPEATSVPQQQQLSKEASNVISEATTPAGAHIPTALDLVSLMNPKHPSTTATPIASRPDTGKEVVGQGSNSRIGSGVTVVAVTVTGENADIVSKEAGQDTQLKQGLVSAGQKVDAEAGMSQSEAVGLDGIKVDVTTPRSGSSQQVQELNARLGTCVSAPPAVDMDPPSVKEVEEEEKQRTKTAVGSPIAQTVTVKLSAAQEQLSKSGTPLAMKITNKNTGEVQIREIIHGTVVLPIQPPSTTSMSAVDDAAATEMSGQQVSEGQTSQTAEVTTASTFMTPEGKIVITSPIPVLDALAQGLAPVEVHGDKQALMRSQTGISLPPPTTCVDPIPKSATDPTMKIKISPCPSPSRQVSFGPGFGGALGGAGVIGNDSAMPSPRSSRLRRSRTADLAIVVESNLGPVQESAIDMMKKMMTDEEGLNKKQLKALDSMRSAVKALEARNSLSDEEIARTLTMLTLASQMSHEAFQLGVKPDSIFRTFSHMNSQSLSQLAPPKSLTSPGRANKQPSTGFEGREPTKDAMTRETTLASVQEVDAENAEEEQNLEAEVDLSQLKELPLLDIADTKPAEEEFSKPSSAFLLPSEATVGSSFQDELETPLADLIEDDPIKMLKESAKRKSQDEMMDDGSNLEKARSNITEREATYGGSESNTGADGVGSEQQHSTLSMSKQATEASMADAQKSFMGKSLSSLEGMKIEGMTEEEIRASSSQSRASLRSMYKVKLGETKSAAEERRSKSPVITLPTQMTIDAELILDDDDEEEEEMVDENMIEDMLMDLKDPSMYEIGTSPPPGILSRDSTLPGKMDSDERKLNRKQHGAPSREPTDHSKQPVRPVQKIIRKGKDLLSHPLLQEYLMTYQSVIGFKDSISKMFLDKDMMSAHQLTSDLETLAFDQTQKAMPQIEQLTKNAYYVLEEISSLITNILVYDREPPVSSLIQFSREATQKSFAPPTVSVSEIQVIPPPPPTTMDLESRKIDSRPLSTSSDKVHIKELQEHYNTIKIQLDEDKKQHQEQLQHNTVVMMGMQDTINDLQRELSTIGKASTKKTGQFSKPQSSSSVRGLVDKPASPEATIMFTRLDSERNAKIMKKAVVEDKINAEKYKEAVARMDEYVSLPAQRLAHLVKKYVHHSHMRQIEEKVKKSSSINEDVFDVLDKMETLQNQRARQWAERMDEMGMERLRLANLLMTTLDDIEQESGIFLIKPMYSYRGRDLKHGVQGKVARSVRSQHHKRAPTPSNDASSFIPAPTPASNYRLVKHERHFLHQQQQQQQAAFMGEMKPSSEVVTSVVENGKEVKVSGNGLTFNASSPRMVWNMQASHLWTGKEDPNAFNTPRILELDINRMLIGQNNISSRVPFPPSDDRLINASQNSLRSYVTVNRPTAKFGAEKTDRRPGSGLEQPPGSRSSSRRVHVSETDRDIPASIETSPPLPPITPTHAEDGEEEDVRPPSVAFTNEEDENEEEEEKEEEEGGTGSNTRGEPPQSPPGSSLYQSVNRFGDSDLVPRNTRTSSGFSFSEDD